MVARIIVIVALLFGPPAAPDSPLDLKRQYLELESGVLPYWQAVVRRQPRNPWVWHYLGIAAFETGYYAAAERALREAMKLDPGQGIHALQLAEFLLRRGRLAESVDYYEAAALLIDDDQQRGAIHRTRVRIEKTLSDLDTKATRLRRVGAVLLLTLLLCSVLALRASYRHRNITKKS
jgi:cytochrome c-type biogenesis protein CcmH/NrfG